MVLNTRPYLFVVLGLVCVMIAISLFKYFDFRYRKRVETLKAEGLVVSAADVLTGKIKPRRVIKSNLGYGIEYWALSGDDLRLSSKGAYLEGAKLIQPEGGGKKLEQQLAELGYEVTRVDFKR